MDAAGAATLGARRAASSNGCRGRRRPVRRRRSRRAGTPRGGLYYTLGLRRVAARARPAVVADLRGHRRRAFPARSTATRSRLVSPVLGFRRPPSHRRPSRRLALPARRRPAADTRLFRRQARHLPRAAGLPHPALRRRRQPDAEISASGARYIPRGYRREAHVPYDLRKQKFLARVRRIRGQVEAVERALEKEAGCER